MKNKELKIARNNISALMADQKKILNKTITFDTSKVDEKMIMENLPSDNDKVLYYP